VRSAKLVDVVAQDISLAEVPVAIADVPVLLSCGLFGGLVPGGYGITLVDLRCAEGILDGVSGCIEGDIVDVFLGLGLLTGSPGLERVPLCHAVAQDEVSA